jgi:hypothetical protein
MQAWTTQCFARVGPHTHKTDKGSPSILFWANQSHWTPKTVRRPPWGLICRDQGLTGPLIPASNSTHVEPGPKGPHTGVKITGMGGCFQWRNLDFMSGGVSELGLLKQVA